MQRHGHRYIRAAILNSVIVGCGIDPGSGGGRPQPTSDLIGLSDEKLGTAVQAAIATITPPPTVKLIPAHVGSGDREFKGNGPIVNVDAWIEVINKTDIVGHIYMNARETKSDWTEADQTWDVMLHHDTRPIRIVSDTSTSDGYTDNNHDDDTLPEPFGELVNHFLCTGDVVGNDAGMATGVRVFWNAITIEQSQDSCVNHCGGQAGSCWCDAVCVSFGDCCADKCSTCGGC